MLGAYIFIIVISSWIDPLIIMQCPSWSLVLFFKVYFVWYENCYSEFLLISIFMEYHFLSSHFQSVCVSRSDLGLLWTKYTWVLFLYPFNQSVSLCWSIEFIYIESNCWYICIIHHFLNCFVLVLYVFPSHVPCL